MINGVSQRSCYNLILALENDKVVNIKLNADGSFNSQNLLEKFANRPLKGLARDLDGIWGVDDLRNIHKLV